MPLSCDCELGDISDYAWIYYYPNEFSTLVECKRRPRCCSCKEFINQGSTVVQFPRYRAPRHVIEENIHGDEVPLAPYFMCEHCGEIFLNLSAVGYCMDICESMDACLTEYHMMTGFTKRAQNIP